jgi:hypothetical protein
MDPSFLHRVVGSVYHWQTLIAGGFALVAARIAYRAAIRQVKETRKAAELQVKALAEQTKTIKDESDRLRKSDQRRLA